MYLHASTCVHVCTRTHAQAKFDAAKAEKQRLQDDADLTKKRMDAANALINGLSGEKAHMLTHIYTHVYTHVYAHVYPHVYTCVHRRENSKVYTHVYTHVYTCVHRRENALDSAVKGVCRRDCTARWRLRARVCIHIVPGAVQQRVPRRNAGSKSSLHMLTCIATQGCSRGCAEKHVLQGPPVKEDPRHSRP